MKELKIEKKELLKDIKYYNWCINSTTPTEDEIYYYKKSISISRGRIVEIDEELEKYKIVIDRDKKLNKLLK